MNKNILKGSVYVALGATSYGMLATFVKLAYKEGYNTAEVSLAQFIYGIIGLLLINLFNRANSSSTQKINATSKNIFHLMLAGTSLGMTSVFYYLCVSYINVSLAIVLLMQTVWLGVLLEWILDKKRPSFQKIIAVFLVFIGTILATNIIFSSVQINPYGVFWGLMAAASFTTTMFTANKIAPEVTNSQRSLYMLLGGILIVATFSLYYLMEINPNGIEFKIGIFGKYGLFLALFGTIIPPMFLNAGFPKTGIGLGSIIASLELPVSVLMAYFILSESVLLLQWLGIILIIFAIVIMNLKWNKNETI